jgi:hypothetical protein
LLSIYGPKIQSVELTELSDNEDSVDSLRRSFLMTGPPIEPHESEDSLQPLPPAVTAGANVVVAWSSFLFVLLQSVCTFFTALDGLRVLIGVGALTSIIAAGKAWDKFHTDWIRVPMMGLALAGALLNLIVLMHVRYLRNRPASKWRRQPLTRGKIRKERVQLVLSLATLVLVLVEGVTHLRTFHHF